MTCVLLLAGSGCVRNRGLVRRAPRQAALAGERGPAAVVGQAGKHRAAAHNTPLAIRAFGFQANQGLTDPAVKFIQQRGATLLFLTPQEVVWRLPRPTTAPRGKAAPARADRVVRMRFIGSNPGPEIRGEELLTTQRHYFLGNDPRQWHTAVPTFARVRYHSLYPGIDLVFHEANDSLEYDFEVAPGADPSIIRLAFDAPTDADIVDGQLRLRSGGSDVVQGVPFAFQSTPAGRKPVACRFVALDHRLVGDRSRLSAGFAVTAYDRGQPLIIDPAVAYATAFGTIGGNSDLTTFDIAADHSGNVWATGTADGRFEFPTTEDAVDTEIDSFRDAFVARLAPDGSIAYFTFLGGDLDANTFGDDQGGSIVVDADGNAYVAGVTSSLDFPTTADAFSDKLNGGVPGPAGVVLPTPDAFLTKLSPTGALLYSTYFGGAFDEFSYSGGKTGVALDPSGNVYLAGRTSSRDLPVKNALQGTLNVGPSQAHDIFVAKFDRDFQLRYATYLGGPEFEDAARITADAAGAAYILGIGSNGSPVTPGAFQTTTNQEPYYIAKIAPDGSRLEFATFLNDVVGEVGAVLGDIGVDDGGNVYVVGNTSSGNFPTTPGAFQTMRGGGTDVFVAKLNPTGTALVYATLLGGNGDDMVYGGSAVDAAGHVYVALLSGSSNFPPMVDAFETQGSAALVKLNTTGSALELASRLGAGLDTPTSLALGAAGEIYVGGGVAPRPGQFAVLKIDTAATSCPGDCDGDGEVSIDEIILGVNIALGSRTTDACSQFDVDGDGEVAVNEIIQAVNAALAGCA